ncbi:MAG: hypothetical protein C0599_00730, partial [Salinivirgaceae bacterium]
MAWHSEKKKPDNCYFYLYIVVYNKINGKNQVKNPIYIYYKNNTLVQRNLMKVLLKFILILVLTITITSVHAHQRKRVLYISSYNSSFPSFFNQLNGIKSILDSIPIDLDVEFMDSKRFQDKETKYLFIKSLKNKLRKKNNYDAILAADDNAFNFVLDYQDSLFKNIPIVFLGVNDRVKALEQNNNPFVTGIVEEISMKETLDAMVKIFPGTQRIHVIVDGTNSGQNDLIKFYKATQSSKNIDYNIIDLTQLTFSSYIKKLKNIPSEDLVLLISAYTDKTKHTINFDETIQIINDNLKAPLFNLWYHGMGKGVFGGKLVSHFEQGKNAALFAKKILNGTPVQKIKVLEESPNIFVFDYHKLKQFKISDSQLPTKHIIYNEPNNFYKENKTLIQTISVIFIFLLIFILAQYASSRKLKTIHKELEKQNSNNQWLKERQSALITNISDVIGIIDKNGNITYKSPNIKTLFGYDPAELIGKPWHSTVHKDDINRLEQILQKIITTKDLTKKVEFNYLHKNGDIIPVELTATNTLNNPYIDGVLINYNNIAERKNFEIELKSSESKY